MGTEKWAKSWRGIKNQGRTFKAIADTVTRNTEEILNVE
jgi:hypothetical protein